MLGQCLEISGMQLVCRLRLLLVIGPILAQQSKSWQSSKWNLRGKLIDQIIISQQEHRVCKRLPPASPIQFMFHCELQQNKNLLFLGTEKKFQHSLRNSNNQTKIKIKNHPDQNLKQIIYSRAAVKQRTIRLDVIFYSCVFSQKKLLFSVKYRHWLAMNMY